MVTGTRVFRNVRVSLADVTSTVNSARRVISSHASSAYLPPGQMCTSIHLCVCVCVSVCLSVCNASKYNQRPKWLDICWKCSSSPRGDDVGGACHTEWRSQSNTTACLYIIITSAFSVTICLLNLHCATALLLSNDTSQPVTLTATSASTSIQRCCYYYYYYYSKSLSLSRTWCWYPLTVSPRCKTSENLSQ